MVRARAAAISLLVIYMLVSVHLARFLDAPRANALVGEDGFIEMLGAICLLLGAVFAFVALLRLRSNHDAGRLKQLAYLGLVLFLVLAAGEELSWGQRLLGFETPAPIAKVNAQEETNLHNLAGDANGQNLSSDVYKACWMAFGILIPLLALLPRVGLVLRRHLPVLPLWLAVLFVGQQLLWKPISAEWRADPSAWNATYRAPIGGDRFRVRTLAEAEMQGVSAPAGASEIMETNVQVLLGVGGLCLLLGAARRRGAAGIGVGSDVAALTREAALAPMHDARVHAGPDRDLEPARNA